MDQHPVRTGRAGAEAMFPSKFPAKRTWAVAVHRDNAEEVAAEGHRTGCSRMGEAHSMDHRLVVLLHLGFVS